MFASVYHSRRVLVTGHTGFKGSWLSEWLLLLGAEVAGYSLPPPTRPAAFEQLGLARRLRHEIGDTRDLAHLKEVIADFKPEIVFHLAAQPIVRVSYANPVDTYATNVLGTVNVLEAIRTSGLACTVVVATSDKVYENLECDRGYDEDDRLGGFDPYSSSKACAELVVAAYRRSYFKGPSSPIALASARAGNVIGGGDWAQYRILPDCIRSLMQGETITVRCPDATRPWEHVLECLSGYLALGARLDQARRNADESALAALSDAFNFGPGVARQPVRHLVEEVLKQWPGKWLDTSDPKQPHEAQRLHLSIEKAGRVLGWRPTWTFERTIQESVRWYRLFSQPSDPSDVASFTQAQIRAFAQTARDRGIAWAQPSSAHEASTATSPSLEASEPALAPAAG